MKVSPSGVSFIAAHEGVVLKAYRDPVGILTIGTGFTMRSRVFAAWFRAARGHDLRLGDTITRAENDMLLAKLLDEEYGPPVTKRFGNLSQTQYDACLSVVYNCGPGTLKDSWASLLAARDVPGAAARLRNTRITAGGKRLQGLVTRRAHEAALLERGDYGPIVVPSSSDEEIKAYQADLKTLGYYKGAVDGIRGQATMQAVMDFQRAEKLTVDGVVGPATRAAITRAKAKRGGAASTVGVGGVVAVGAAAVQQVSGGVNWWLVVGLALLAVAVGGAVFWVWHNQGRLGISK